MDVASYEAAATSTAIYPGVGTGTLAALSYVGLGLMGESSEVLEKELAGDVAGIGSELGDVAWYLARFHTELGISAQVTFLTAAAQEGLARDGDTPGLASTQLVVAVGRLGELTKKALRDDDATLTPARRAAMQAALVTVLVAWLAVHRAHGLSVADTFAANAAKLGDRRARGVLAGSGDHR